MEWVIGLLVVIVFGVIGTLYYLKRKSFKSSNAKLDQSISTENVQVTVKGSSRDEFEISVTNDHLNLQYKVKDGNIIGVKLPGSDQYYEYVGV